LLFLQAPVHAQGTAPSPDRSRPRRKAGWKRGRHGSQADAKFSVSVVTDAQGRYSFPTPAGAGHMRWTIRAIGYDLNGKASADVAGEKTATVI